MPLLTPTILLLTLSTITATALTVTALVSRSRRRQLSRWAQQHNLQYVHADRFLLGKRVFRQLPLPGAADISVRDIAYHRDGDKLHCVFTVRCTLGTVGRRRYLRRVCHAIDTAGETFERFGMLESEPSPDAYTAARNAL
jgi:hypothetical protein